MASVFSHAVAGLAIGAAFWQPETPARVWVLGAVLAAAPDLDAIGFRFGIAYGDVLGHRGLTHSLPFAAALAALVAVIAWSPGSPIGGLRLWLYFFLAIGSHGVLDAFTNGGLGVAFFAPFENRRYFFPFRPIEVSPIGVTEFFSAWGRRVIANEIVWVWFPSLIFAATALWLRRKGFLGSDVRPT